MQLNLEQKKLIRSSAMGHSIIRGVAGSGKTTVAVHRISFLLDNYCYGASDKILMVTYNKSLTNYIEYIYSQIDKDDQYGLFDKTELQKNVKITNIDKLLYSYFRAFCQEKGKLLQIVQGQKEIEIWQKSLSNVKKTFGDVKILDAKYLGFLKNEIAWIKACNYVEYESYQSADRIGRMGSKGSNEGPQKLQKNSRIRQAIYELMATYTKECYAQNLCDFQDVALYALKYLKNHKISGYTHIIIDESQDLSRVQLQCLMQMYDSEKDYSSIMFVADTAQSIYSTSWLVKGRSFTSIGLDMTGRSTSLAKNYRTTTQIAEAAYSLIREDSDIVNDDNFVKPSLIDKQGIYPVFVRYNTIGEEILGVEKLLKKLLKRYEAKEIAIVARTKRILEEVKKETDENIKMTLYTSQEGINFGEEAIKLLTMHSIKGLEFKIVILMGLSDKLIPNPMLLQENEDAAYVETMERKLLYVGMTRATERLYMSCHGVPSRFISSIEPKFLKMREGAAFRCLTDIPLQNYMFKDKIADLYSKEEKIRQWLLNELKTVYHYPSELLDVEYKVQVFSKMGFVDVVVMVYKNNRIVPYIMAEVKQYQAGISVAEEQLRSYMAVSPEVCYGIITDGNELKLINKEGVEVEDIPKFDVSMLPSGIAEYIYVDFVRDKKYRYMCDEECPDEFILQEENAQRSLKENELVQCPVFAEIAAGTPIEMTEGITEICKLPLEWISVPAETFLLTVRGNSMINADINNGDKVVLRKTNVVDNGQIAAVELDGNVTLKTFRKMGSTILLIPENDEYEPMMVNADQIRILGHAIGVIKKKNNV